MKRKTNFKMIILIRRDFNLSKGKIGVQSAHASAEAVLKSAKEIIDKWRKFSKKVVLAVEMKMNY